MFYWPTEHIMKFSTFTKLVILTIALAGCATPKAVSGEKKAEIVHADSTPYNPEANAHSDVETALATSKAEGTMTIIAMGANWCHDSRGFAWQFEKDRFQTLLKNNYRLVYVDVGKKNRNIDIAQKFGVDNIVGTPTVFIIGPDGDVLNLETAPTWRNAASRSEDEIFDYFESFIKNNDDFSAKTATK